MAPFNVEQFCRLGDIPVRFLKGLQDRFFFRMVLDVFEPFLRRRLSHFTALHIQAIRNVVTVNIAAAVQGNEPFHDIAQLPHIAGPLINA